MHQSGNLDCDILEGVALFERLHSWYNAVPAKFRESFLWKDVGEVTVQSESFFDCLTKRAITASIASVVKALNDPSNGKSDLDIHSTRCDRLSECASFLDSVGARGQESSKALAFMQRWFSQFEVVHSIIHGAAAANVWETVSLNATKALTDLLGQEDPGVAELTKVYQDKIQSLAYTALELEIKDSLVKLKDAFRASMAAIVAKDFGTVQEPLSQEAWEKISSKITEVSAGDMDMKLEFAHRLCVLSNHAKQASMQDFSSLTSAT